MRCRPGLLTVAFVTLVSINMAQADDDDAAVTIERVHWGFDGKAQERTFVPLSVLIANNTPYEFEGRLSLTKLVQSNKPIDASITRDVYLGPTSRRWVQFVPYVVSDWEQWRLTWGHAKDQQYDIPTPQMGERATVLLYDPDDLQLAGGVLRRFPINLFPSSVTATDGLRGMAFDRTPDWQGARRQAFLDWLRLGGRVYLLQDEQGRFPVFPDSLNELNGRGERFLVGAGIVERIPSTVRELEPDFVKQQMLAETPRTPEERRYERYRTSPQYSGTAPLISHSGWDRDTQMFIDLRSIARFARRWWVIYVLSFLYLLALFPLCFRVGREAKDYRWMYVVLASSVGLFTFGFASLGKLGASERNRARSVAVAQQLGEGVYDVTQWTCVGVRAAGDYEVAHSGSGRIYSTSQDIERIDGAILAGPQAKMDLSIPPASTRTILHRSRAESVPLGLRVVQSASDERGLSLLTLEVGPEFPDETMQISAVHSGQIYQLSRFGDRLQLVAASRKPLVSFLTDHYQLPRIGWGGFSSPGAKPDREVSLVYKDALRTLVGNSFGLGDRVDLRMLELPDEIVRVFAYATQPASLQITSNSFPDQRGYVLFCVDLPTAGGPAATSRQQSDNTSE